MQHGWVSKSGTVTWELEQEAEKQMLASWLRQPHPLKKEKVNLQKQLVAFQTLCSCPSHDGGDGAPLCRHQLGQVEKLLILCSTPLCLLDAGVQPLKPAIVRHNINTLKVSQWFSGSCALMIHRTECNQMCYSENSWTDIYGEKNKWSMKWILFSCSC